MATLDQPGDLSVTPPFEHYRPSCDDCGARSDLGDLFVLPTGAYCLPCAAPHAVEILDPQGSTRVTVQDVEDAAAVLSAWAKIGKAKKLAQLSGARGPKLHPVMAEALKAFEPAPAPCIDCGAPSAPLLYAGPRCAACNDKRIEAGRQADEAERRGWKRANEGAA